MQLICLIVYLFSFFLVVLFFFWLLIFAFVQNHLGSISCMIDDSMDHMQPEKIIVRDLFSFFIPLEVAIHSRKRSGRRVFSIVI